MQVIQFIQNRIYEIRGQHVMLHFGLAELYETGTRISNQTVNRNLKRYPKKFIFQLKKEEWHNMRPKIATSYSEDADDKLNAAMSLQFVMTFKRPSKALPYAFTEQLKELKERVGEHDVQLIKSDLRCIGKYAE